MLVACCAAAAWPSSSPLEPLNAGRPLGERHWAWIFLACAAGAFAAYVAGLLALTRARVGTRAVAVLGLAIQLAPLGAPLLLSTDAWTYWHYGRVASLAGGNPYRDAPRDFAGEPSYRYVGASWRDEGSVYGPAFTLASEPIARVAGESASAAAWIYKMLAALAVVAAAALAALLARRRAFAFALVAWNPLLALHFAGGGHNDAWMAALVLAALALAAAGHRGLAGAAWALAVLVKWVPVVFLVLRAVEARASGRRVAHAGFAVTALIVGALATWRYGSHWLGALGPLARNANMETRFALPHRVEELGLPRWLAIGLFAAAFLVAYAWLVREAWHGRARLGLAAVLLLLAVPYLAPWYTVWALPLAAAEDDPPAQWLAVALSVYLLPQTVPI